jgi:hypothetical protein
MGLPKPMGQAGWAGQLPKACRAQAQGPLGPCDHPPLTKKEVGAVGMNLWLWRAEK